MRSQEGYIELDGEIVSVAARKAYEVAKRHDDEVNKKVEEEERRQQQYRVYRVSEQGISDVKTALEKSKVLKSWEVDERGWFFTYTVLKEKECVDYKEFLKVLESLHPAWDNFCWYDVLFSPTDLLGKREKEIKQGIERLQFRNDSYKPVYWRYSHSANYYRQFFDLKGKVLLTLEQYSEIKEYL